MTAALSSPLSMVASHSGSTSAGEGNIDPKLSPPFSKRTLARQLHRPGPWYTLFRLDKKIPPEGVSASADSSEMPSGRKMPAELFVLLENW